LKPACCVAVHKKMEISCSDIIVRSVPRGYTKDEGRSLEAGLQEQASNRLKLHRSKAIVVSVEGKGMNNVSGMKYGDERKRIVDEVSKRYKCCQNRKLRVFRDKIQEKPVYCLSGNRHKDGVNIFQAYVWNVGT